MEWTLWGDRMDEVSAATVDQAGPFPTFLQRDWRTLEWRNFGSFQIPVDSLAKPLAVVGW
jgi:hypothetical protein